jgi:hypothetical protein
VTAPVEATALDGAVWIKADPATARDMAEAWSAAYAGCDELEQSRPRWMDDVVAIHTAAMRADLQNGHRPPVVTVPLRLSQGAS